MIIRQLHLQEPNNLAASCSLSREIQDLWPLLTVISIKIDLRRKQVTKMHRNSRITTSSIKVQLTRLEQKVRGMSKAWTLLQRTHFCLQVKRMKTSSLEEEIRTTTSTWSRTMRLEWTLLLSVDQMSQTPKDVHILPMPRISKEISHNSTSKLTISTRISESLFCRTNLSMVMILTVAWKLSRKTLSKTKVTSQLKREPIVSMSLSDSGKETNSKTTSFSQRSLLLTQLRRELVIRLTSSRGMRLIRTSWSNLMFLLPKLRVVLIRLAQQLSHICRLSLGSRQPTHKWDFQQQRIHSRQSEKWWMEIPIVWHTISSELRK